MPVGNARYCADCPVILDRQNTTGRCYVCERQNRQAECPHPDDKVYREAGALWCGECNRRLVYEGGEWTGA